MSVTFSSPANGAQALFEGALSVTVTTDDRGMTPPLTPVANMVNGTYTVTASVAGVVNPARFFATNLAGAGGAIPAGAFGPFGAFGQRPQDYGFGHVVGSCTFPTTCSPTNWGTALVSGDFNNDGVKDLVGYNKGFSEVSYRMGFSNGGFSEPPVNSAVPLPNGLIFDIIAGDFNMDGKLDVAVPTDTSASSIRLMNGNGDGTFSEGPLIAVPGFTSGMQFFLATADLNKDGMLDIVTSRSNVLLGTGPGTFSEVPMTFLANRAEVAIGDLDNDGILDLAFGTGSTTVAVRRGHGDGTFDDPEHYTIGNWADRIALGDFNGDGRLDIAASLQPVPTGFQRAGFAVILNTGLGTGSRFASPRQQIAKQLTFFGGIAAADLNRDGLDDIIQGVESLNLLQGPSPETYWYLSHGDGNFSLIGQTLALWRPRDTVVEDFNRDGLLDVATLSQGSGGNAALGSGLMVSYNVGRIAASVVPTAGTPQSIRVSTAGAALGARVLDAAGNIVQFARVTFTAPTTGPSATLPGGASVFHTVTLHAGDTSAAPVANNQVGPYTIAAASPMAPGSNATATYAITNVTPPPVAGADGPFTTVEDTPLIVAAPGLLANDSDPDNTPITAQMVDPPPSQGVLQLAADGGFVYTPNPNAYGTDTFRYRAFDGGSGSNVVTVTVNITATPDPPTVVSRAFGVNEDVTLSVAATGVLLGATDPDGASTFTAQLVQQAGHGVVTLNGDGSFTYVPQANFNGADSFTFTATDNTGLISAPGTITINVAPVYDPPVAAADAYSTAEDSPLSVGAPGVLGNDFYNPGAQAALAIAPSHGTVTVMPDGSFVYTPAENYHGPDAFSYDVVEDEGNVRAVVSIDVTAVNDAPSAADDAVGTIVGAPISVPAPGVLDNDGDVDHDALAASLVLQADHGTAVVAADGSFTYTPALNFVGADAFSYSASDGSEARTARVVVTVLPGTTTTSLLLSAGSIALGDTVTLTATVSVNAPGAGIPSGSVTFMNGAAAVGTAAVSGGIATFSTASLPPGMLSIGAVYSGESAFGGSASPSSTLEVIANTPVGEDVVSTPVDEATGQSPITLQFDEVTTPGTTTIEIGDEGPAAPSGFKIGDPPIVYNLETTAVFNGDITICFNYDETAVRNEHNLVLFHFEGGQWTNITTAIDADANVVCGTTSHLSPFAIGEPNEAPALGAITSIVDAAAPHLAVTASASFTDADVDDVHAAVWEWGDGTSTPASISGGVANGTHTYAAAGHFSIRLTITDGGSAASATTSVQVGEEDDNTAPAITATASPREIWPPNNKMVPVTITGRIADDVSGVASASFTVSDEYGQVQPSGPITVRADGSYSVIVMLQASRNGNDKDGRLYTIAVRASDQAGNTGQADTSTVVLHDQRKK